MFLNSLSFILSSSKPVSVSFTSRFHSLCIYPPLLNLTLLFQPSHFLQFFKTLILLSQCWVPMTRGSRTSIASPHNMSVIKSINLSLLLLFFLTYNHFFVVMWLPNYPLQSPIQVFPSLWHIIKQIPELYCSFATPSYAITPCILSTYFLINLISIFVTYYLWILKY